MEDLGATIPGAVSGTAGEILAVAGIIAIVLWIPVHETDLSHLAILVGCALVHTEGSRSIARRARREPIV